MLVLLAIADRYDSRQLYMRYMPLWHRILSCADCPDVRLGFGHAVAEDAKPHPGRLTTVQHANVKDRRPKKRSLREVAAMGLHLLRFFLVWFATAHFLLRVFFMLPWGTFAKHEWLIIFYNVGLAQVGFLGGPRLVTHPAPHPASHF